MFWFWRCVIESYVNSAIVKSVFARFGRSECATAQNFFKIIPTEIYIFFTGLAEFYDNIHQLTQENEGLFPVEVDLTDNAFIYEHSFETLPPDEDNPDEDGGTTSGGGGDNNAGGADIEYGTDEDLLVCRNLLDDE